MKTPLQALKSLVSDIQSMRSRHSYYGPFSEFDDNSFDGVVVEWPNLEITTAEAQEVLNAFATVPTLEDALTFIFQSGAEGSDAFLRRYGDLFVVRPVTAQDAPQSTIPASITDIPDGL